jgi:hypothetical protein
MPNLNELLGKAERIANDFAHLKIITAVGDFSLQKVTAADGSVSWQVLPTPDGSNSAIETDINLVQGDITNRIDRRLAAEDSEAIREFHNSQIEKAEDIVKGNIEALKSLIGLIVDVESKNAGGAPAALPALPTPGDGTAT